MQPDFFMRRTLLVLFLMFCVLPLCAQGIQDIGSWTSFNLKSSLSQTVSLEGRVEWRTYDCMSATNQIFARGCVAWKPNSFVRLDVRGDYGYYPSSGGKLRFIPGFTLSDKAYGHSLYFRQWWMHSRDLGGAKSSDVLRSKVGVSRTVNGTAFTPHVDCELFYWDTFTQHRYYAGTRVKLKHGNSLDMFLLYQFLPPIGKRTLILGLSWTIQN